MKKGFTLLELLIIVALLVLLATVLLISLNPWGQINKSQDSKRKSELTQLNKVFEDYYNDKNCYPTPDTVCYDANGELNCHICGNESGSPSFSTYLTRLPCDPQQPVKSYLYEVDNLNCPTRYRIYSVLNNVSDPIIDQVGCSGGCGPESAYNYGVASPNTNLELGSLVTACLTSGSCDSYCQTIGKTCVLTEAFGTYSDISCNSGLGICSGPACCGQNPIGGQVQSFTCFCQ